MSIKHITPGERFGKLTVICKDTGRRAERNASYLCQCDCGGGSSIRADRLRLGITSTCGGCPKRSTRQQRKYLAKYGPPKPDIRQRKWRWKSGKHRSEYGSWSGARQRCHSPSSPGFAGYGARGITMCDRWRESFDNFMDDMGLKPSPAHSLDRIDGDRGYSPDNCRWATPLEQTLNTSRVHSVVVEGVEFPSLSAASRATGISLTMLWRGLRKRAAVQVEYA